MTDPKRLDCRLSVARSETKSALEASILVVVVSVGVFGVVVVLVDVGAVAVPEFMTFWRRRLVARRLETGSL